MIVFTKSSDTDGVDLTGKFVGKRSTRGHRCYTRPAFVEKQTGNKLKVRFSLSSAGRKGVAGSVLPDLAAWEDTTTWKTEAVAFVCDTIDEAEQIMRASARSIRIMDDVIRLANEEINEMFAALSSAGAEGRDAE